MRKLTKWLGAVALSVLLGATSARANTITLTGSQAPSGSFPGFTEFSYEATLGGNSILKTGDYFVVYDFNGFAGFDNSFGSSTFTFTGSTGVWNATIQPIGPYPTGDGTATGVATVHQPSMDDPTLFNLVFTYVGPNVVSPPLTTLVTVSALAGNGSTTAVVNYGSQDNSSLGAQLLQGSIPGTVIGPEPGGPNDFLPTPAAATGGFALIALLGVTRRRK